MRPSPPAVPGLVYDETVSRRKVGDGERLENELDVHRWKGESKQAEVEVEQSKVKQSKKEGGG